MKDKSEQSFSKIKHDKVTNHKKSKTAKLKTLQNLTQRKVPQQKLMTPTSAKCLQKHSAKSRIKVLKAIHQTI